MVVCLRQWGLVYIKNIVDPLTDLRYIYVWLSIRSLGMEIKEA